MGNTLDYFGGTENKKFEATGYFRIQKEGDYFYLVDPEGNLFISIGMNHIDDTNIKYHSNLNIWKEKYSSSREKWIREGVVKDMRDWGFNTIGWTQENISGFRPRVIDWKTNIDLGHSVSWCVADYKLANMPYALHMPVAPIEDWNGNPIFPDVYSHEFEEYVEWAARSVCVDHEDSPNLIGYFLVDIPAWQPHASGKDFPQLEGLPPQEREKKLFDVASKYYEVVTKQIRSYDTNHLILGDRYNGNRDIPTPVLEAMKPYVDVLSVQYFPSNNQQGYKDMRSDFERWQKITGKAVLNADIGNNCATQWNPHMTTDLKNQGDRAKDYIDAINALIDAPWFIGWHWCSYIENTARGWGCKTPFDEPYSEFMDPVKEYNKAVYDRYNP